jgi:hypothetical protein
MVNKNKGTLEYRSVELKGGRKIVPAAVRSDGFAF